jgi:hypothetical protein
MSLWPDGDCKKDYGYLKTFFAGVDASIVFHHNYDYYLEGKRDPLRFEIDYCSMKNINELYEEMLDYNDITYDNVTLERGDDIILQNKRPEMSLKRSLYSFEGPYLKGFSPYNKSSIQSTADLFLIKEPVRDFYKYKQSCTTFCMNLLLNSGAFDVFDEPITSQFNPGNKVLDLIEQIIEVNSFKNLIEKRFCPKCTFYKKNNFNMIYNIRNT